MTHPTRPRLRNFAKRVALVLLAPLLLVLLEGVLRMFDYGEPENFFIPSGVPGHVRTNERFAWRFTPPELSRAPVPLHISVKKPAGTKRIFLLGSSAAQGYPDPAYGIGPFLETMLNHGANTQRHEVINCAMTAMNSHVVRAIAEECAAYEPDIFLLYCGNNEVIGPFGPGTVFKSYQAGLPVIRFQVWFSSLRLAQLMRDTLARFRAPRETDWRGMDLFSGSRVAADDPRLDTVRKNYAANLRAMRDLAHARGAKTILCTVPVNLRDCPPFAPDSRVGDATAQQLYEAGKFSEACDADALRFRADSGINAAVRALASEAPAGDSLVDLAAVLDGNENFFEHVHLNLLGSWRAAGLVFTSLTGAEPPDYETCRTALPITPFDEFRIQQQVAQLCAAAPFTAQAGHAGRQSAREAAVLRLRASFTDVMAASAQAQYAAATAARPDDFLLACNRAQMLAMLNDQSGALLAWERASVLRPWHLGTKTQLAMTLARAGHAVQSRRLAQDILASAPRLAVVRKSIGDLFALIGDLPAAERCYREALELRPGLPDAMLNLAALLSHDAGARGQESEALLRRLIEKGSGGAVAELNLAALLLRRGDPAASLPHFERALALDPSNAVAHNNCGVALMNLGRFAEAARQFEEVLRLDPAHEKARRSLEEIRRRLPAGASQ